MGSSFFAYFTYFIMKRKEYDMKKIMSVTGWTKEEWIEFGKFLGGVSLFMADMYIFMLIG